MSSIVAKLSKHKLINPEHAFVVDTAYEVIMGSTAYGVSENSSDIDVYGVCVPNKAMIFPHLTGYIGGFDDKPANFEVYQKHHVVLDGKEYDTNIYSIIKYFRMCAISSPNILDSLFVPTRCILQMNDVGGHMRANRHMFLSKCILDKMRGYAFTEMKKLESGYDPKKGGNRAENVEKYGYDTKSGYHVIRLMLQAEMVLAECDLDLERNRDQLKYARNGGYTLSELKEWFKQKEMDLATLYTNSELPVIADFDKIRVLLKECLEIQFGSLEIAQQVDADAIEVIENIRRLVNK